MSLEHIIQRFEFDTLGLLIRFMPTMIGISLFLRKLFIRGIWNYVQISFPIHIVWFSQLISSENEFNWLYDMISIIEIKT